MSKKFYITAAIPYVNAAPHIGHALEFVQTDTIARYQKLLGKEVVVLSGGDENALKNVQAAKEAKIPVQEFVDKNTEIYYQLTKKLNAQFDIWQKGSDIKTHYPSSQKLWQLCEKDIYKKNYSGLYCVGCAAFYNLKELNKKGECHEHLGKKLEKVSEENYFFKLSKYQKNLIKLIKSDKLKIIPDTRKNEVLSFIEGGLKDISISRSNERARNWGVPVPNDNTQRIYVWFDALNIYQSGVGFGWDENKYKNHWPADLHVIGKGILRFHAVYWPAFLLSAGLDLPKSIFVHGYFTINGQKMSKTLGNIIDPFSLVDTYGAEGLRYYLLAKFNPFTDGDFSEDKLKNAYNGDLAKGLGNLVARVAKLAESNKLDLSQTDFNRPNRILEEIKPLLDNYRFDKALEYIWGAIRGLDKYIEQERPWEKSSDEANKRLGQIIVGSESLKSINEIAEALKPFLPETSEKITKQFKGPKIKSGKPLFPRIN